VSGCGYGLDFWEDLFGGFGWFFGFACGWVAGGAWAVAHLFHEALESAAGGFAWRWDFGYRGERAVEWVELDGFELEDGFGLGGLRFAREVGGGDAEGVEEQAGSL
jgi:hypothetical protein